MTINRNVCGQNNVEDLSKLSERKVLTYVRTQMSIFRKAQREMCIFLLHTSTFPTSPFSSKYGSMPRVEGRYMHHHSLACYHHSLMLSFAWQRNLFNFIVTINSSIPDHILFLYRLTCLCEGDHSGGRPS